MRMDSGLVGTQVMHETIGLVIIINRTAKDYYTIRPVLTSIFLNVEAHTLTIVN